MLPSESSITNRSTSSGMAAIRSGTMSRIEGITTTGFTAAGAATGEISCGSVTDSTLIEGSSRSQWIGRRWGLRLDTARASEARAGGTGDFRSAGGCCGAGLARARPTSRHPRPSPRSPAHDESPSLPADLPRDRPLPAMHGLLEAAARKAGVRHLDEHAHRLAAGERHAGEVRNRALEGQLVPE